MAAVRQSASERYFGKMHSVDLQLVKADCSCDDVDDRIGCAHFVKMNFFRRYTVDFSLGLGQTVEDLDAGFFDLERELACLDKLTNLLPGPRRFIAGRPYLKLCGSDRVDNFLGSESVLTPIRAIFHCHEYNDRLFQVNRCESPMVI